MLVRNTGVLGTANIFDVFPDALMISLICDDGCCQIYGNKKNPRQAVACRGFYLNQSPGLTFIPH